jgi:hypothetical protein
MATILTRQQIAVLYGLPADTKEVYAFGARIKHSVPGAKRRRFTLDDYGTPEAEAYFDRLLKTPPKPAQREVVVESEVQEIL